MTENLNYASDYSHCYDDDPTNCKIYGRLYKSSTVCPSGWHVPSKTELESLVRAVGGESVAGKKLKSAQEWDGTDSYGFTALPSGTVGLVGVRNYSRMGERTCFLSSTNGPESDSPYGRGNYALCMDSGSDETYFQTYVMVGHSVRCIKD